MAELSGGSWGPAVAPYRALLEQFVAGILSAPDFESKFFPMYKNDPSLWPDEIFTVLDGFFADVDEYQPDPALRAQIGGIDEDQLRSQAATTLQRLAALSL